MYYFYVIKSSKDGNLYKGFSKNPSKRLASHNSGRVFATKNRRPFTLIYSEKFSTKEEAIAKEKYYKGFKGGKELATIINSL